MAHSALSSEIKAQIQASASSMQLLRHAAEQAKCKLATDPFATIDVTMVNIGHFKASLSRLELNAIIGSRITETITMVSQVIGLARIQPNEVKYVLLVGGSSRLALVRSMLEEKFPQATVCADLDPDTVVAQGAAQLAAQLHYKEAGILQDVAPLGLGVAINGEVMSVSD